MSKYGKIVILGFLRGFKIPEKMTKMRGFWRNAQVRTGVWACGTVILDDFGGWCVHDFDKNAHFGGLLSAILEIF